MLECQLRNCANNIENSLKSLQTISFKIEDADRLLSKTSYLSIQGKARKGHVLNEDISYSTTSRR